MGFGMGAVAAWHFDDLATLVPGTGDDYGPQVRNYYDALGRIVKRVVQPEGSSPETVYYHYDGGRLIEEIDESGSVLASYVYGLYIDEVLQMQRGGQDYTYLNDDLHNVVGLVDETGNVIERYEYGDFGMPSFYDGAGAPLMDGGSPANRSMAGNPFLFTGRRWDPQLRLYDYRTRFMDPQMGRFLRRDTIGLYGDPTNLGNPYTYVGNNPWTHTDPWGQWGWDDDWVETALNVFTPYGRISSEGRAARAAFSAEIADMATEQASGMWEGARVIAQGDGGMWPVLFPCGGLFEAISFGLVIKM